LEYVDLIILALFKDNWQPPWNMAMIGHVR